MYARALRSALVINPAATPHPPTREVQAVTLSTQGRTALRRHLLLALLILGFVLGVLPAAQAASYTSLPSMSPSPVSMAPKPPGSTLAARSWGSTSTALVFGLHGFLADGGVFTPLDVPFPGAIGTEAFGINPRGQIRGVLLDSSFGVHGFLATPDKK